mmetsp:Transcript_11284/g.22894  ORF Transcript_11284/g.22894 Transcript_11284/m.22894 type:complete len:181 (+) Transcript_11284:42-584(+)
MLAGRPLARSCFGLVGLTLVAAGKKATDDPSPPPTQPITGLIPDMLEPLIIAAILLICGYKSFKAIETKGVGNDDTHWLTFWFVYTLFSFLKAVIDYVFKWLIPFYNEGMIAFVVYLAFFGGAQLLYENVFRPLLLAYEGDIDKQLELAQRRAMEAATQAQAAAAEIAQLETMKQTAKEE